MQAIIQAGSKQLRVVKGEKVAIDQITGDVGSEVSFEPLMVLGDSVKVGKPTVAGAKVTAKITKHFRDEKIIVGKYKRRKGFHKRQGHRQYLTEIEITAING